MAYVSLGSSSDPLAPVRAGTSVLKRGHKGDAVRALQALLRSAQLLRRDGDFGPKTEALVLRAQKALGLAADGVVGKQTITAMEAALGSATAASIDPTKRTLVKPLTRAEAIAKAKEAAKAKTVVQINAMRQKGIDDAKAGRYAAPAPTPPPDFNTMNYQAGWMSTGAALPPGVALVAKSASGSTDRNKMLIVGGVAGAAVLLLLVLKR